MIRRITGKAKTIGRYLGNSYTVKASMGRRDLPKSKIGIDFDHDFQPDYQPIKGKEEVIADLKRKPPRPATTSIWQPTRIEKAKPSPGT